MNTYAILIGIMAAGVPCLLFSRPLGGILIMGAGALLWLVALADREKKNRNAWLAAQAASESELLPSDTPPAPESNGEEVQLGGEMWPHVVRIPAEEANTTPPDGCTQSEWDQVVRMAPPAARAVEGGKISLEINE